MKLKWNEIGPEGGSSDSIFDSPGWGCNFGLQGEVFDASVLPNMSDAVLYYLRYSSTT
jgi:hypothetical protein